jgi:hypothetical protein
MAIQTAEATINTKFAIQVEGEGQMFPVLQADCYLPRSMGEKISIGMSEDSFNMLSEDAQSRLDVASSTVAFGDDEVLFFSLPAEMRVVVLGRPRLFVVNKDTNKYSNLAAGMTLAGTKNVTIAKMFVLLLDRNGDFVLDSEGNPQVFTLNLKSTKTVLIGNSKSKPGDGTLTSLNAALCKHYKTKGSLLHLVSVNLVAKPHRFTSASNAKDSSLGIMFGIQGNKVLSDEMQGQAFKVATDKALLKIMADPFRVNGASPNSQQNTSTDAIEESHNDNEVSMEEIPF